MRGLRIAIVTRSTVRRPGGDREARRSASPARSARVRCARVDGLVERDPALERAVLDLHLPVAAAHRRAPALRRRPRARGRLPPPDLGRVDAGQLDDRRAAPAGPRCARSRPAAGSRGGRPRSAGRARARRPAPGSRRAVGRCRCGSSCVLRVNVSDACVGAGSHRCLPARGPDLVASPPMAMPLRGVILAGGTGSRLHPLTQITNKHLLPIYDRPMISYAIEALVQRGRQRADARHRRDARRRVPAPARQRPRVRRRPAASTPTRRSRAASPRRSGWPSASSATAALVVMLGDNVVERSLAPAVENFQAQESGARILLARDRRPGAPAAPRRAGARRTAGSCASSRSPTDPPSELRRHRHLLLRRARLRDRAADAASRPARGELEITDVNNWYVGAGRDGVRRPRGLLGRRRRVDRRLLRGRTTSSAATARTR